MIDEILAQADSVASQSSPDDAARFLAPYRKSACQELEQNPARIGDLLRVTTAQMRFLTAAGSSGKAVGIAEWFLRALHHLEASLPDVEFMRLKRALRESFSHFFRSYALALRNENKHAQMRDAMSTALDLSTQLPLAVVSMLHIYAPLHRLDTIEGEPAGNYLLKRYAEALAALDFSGLRDTPLRNALDEYQYARRSADNIPEARDAIRALCRAYPQDIAVATLANIFEASFPQSRTDS